jgi:putative ABC transport system permease protein
MRPDPFALRVCLAVVRAASTLVPAGDRADWIMEWEAELRHRWGARLSRASEVSMVRRSLGSVVDAAWLRRQLTLDADVVHDASYGIRLLAKTPGFTAVALLVMAIGVGASTAIVTLADSLLFRRLPLPEAERIVTLWHRNLATGAGREDVSPGNAIDWVARATSFSAAATVEPWSLDYRPAGGEPEVITSARVSRGFFDALGMPMLHGRSFLPAEFVEGNDRVVVLSHGLWRERFGGDPGVVGRTLPLDGLPYTVVGVMPDRIDLRLFEARREPRAYLPKYFEEFEPKIRGTGYWNVVARLKPGVTREQAQQEMETISAQLAREHPSNRKIVAEVIPLREHLAGSVRTLLPVLLAAAALLLVVACANTANLLLARGAVRVREFAVRQALGAGRGRLLRQMLAESLLLAAIGGAAGLVLAKWGIAAMAALRPIDVAGIERIAIDVRVASIAVTLSMLAAVMAGLAPAIHLSRVRAGTSQREGGTGPSARRVRAAIVVVEVCLALLLAIGAGLLVRSLRAIERVDPGFATPRVYALQVFAWDRNDTPEKRAVFFAQTLDRMRALPGVAAAGAVSAMPFIEANINIRSSVAIDGVPASVAGDDALIYTTVVAGDYFRVMGIPLERGRLHGAEDRAAAPRAAVISRSAARKFWPAGDPIGAKVRIRFEGRPVDVTVVGIVGDARHDALDRPARPELFLAHAQVPFGSMTYTVRLAPGSPATMAALKAQVWAVDPAQAFYRTATLDELVSRTLVGRRFSALLLAVFGCAALLLAGAGLYGVMSFSASQRSREFGVRLALGAQPRDILRMVVREGVSLVFIGILAGVGAAFWLTRLLRGLLFGVTTTDPLTFAIVAAAALVIGAAASYVPARRAVRSDPLVTLRST